MLVLIRLMKGDMLYIVSPALPTPTKQAALRPAGTRPSTPQQCPTSQELVSPHRAAQAHPGSLSPTCGTPISGRNIVQLGGGGLIAADRSMWKAFLNRERTAAASGAPIRRCLLVCTRPAALHSATGDQLCRTHAKQLQPCRAA